MAVRADPSNGRMRRNPSPDTETLRSRLGLLRELEDIVLVSNISGFRNDSMLHDE